MQQRYYDPVAGRFLSVDPVVADASKGASFNRYTYAGNNPYKYYDPDGRQAQVKGNIYCESYGCGETSVLSPESGRSVPVSIGMGVGRSLSG